MKRVHAPLKSLFLFFLAFLPLSNLFSGVPDTNVLLITIDTWRYDRVGIHGHNIVKTPIIDKIAIRGVDFRRAYAHTPTTLASHTNILTGTTPPYHGVRDNDGFMLHPSFLTLAEHLKQFGYSTGAFVGSFILSHIYGLSQGFDEYKEPVEKPTFLAEEVIQNAVQWLKTRDRKWFCWVHLWDPHKPYSPPAPYIQQYKDDPYSGEVAYVDEQLGKLFSFMEKQGSLKNSLIIIAGDHGESLGEHGEADHGIFAYNSTIHIPLIINGGAFSASVVETEVSHVDIFPTICDVLKISRPPHLQGESLVPLLKKGRKRNNSAIYFESKGFLFHRGWAPLEGFILNSRKYINLPIPELYDLEMDPSEVRNIVSEPQLPALNKTLHDLAERLSFKSSELSRKAMTQGEIEMLRAFNYIAGYRQVPKKTFTAEDDPKVLLPIQNKLDRAKQFSDESKFDQAIKLGNEILKERDDFVGVYLFLSNIYQQLNQLSKAVNTLEAGLSKRPENDELKSALGALLTDTGGGERAVALLREVVAVQDMNPGAWNSLGLAYWKTNNFEKALSSYKKALELNPENALVYGNLGNLYLTAQNLDLAEESFRKAFKLNPKLTEVNNGLGAVYFQRGDFLAAEGYFRKSVELAPSNYLAYYNLLILYARKLKESDKALEIYQKIKERFYVHFSQQERDEIEKIKLEATGK
jgi:arylsulfatase A-like enzyme/Flp pilus assembly protein TadD